VPRHPAELSAADGNTGSPSRLWLPAAQQPLWLQLADHQRPAPKLWMDAYLAAVAIQGGWRLLSLDQDFERFCSAGLQLMPLR
jgi:uncharacterized protein